MRVTDRMTFDQAAHGIAKARERQEEAVGRASSGLRVSHPGDDPAAAGLIASTKVNEQRQESIRETVSRASDELSSADGALDGIGQLLSRARELAVQLSNDTYSAAERAAAVDEVNGLFRSAVALGNTTVGNRFIFGGNKDGASPFDAAGNYVGDTAVRQVEIAPGVLQDASVRADVALKGVGGGSDVFATLSSLSTALSTNDLTNIRASLTGLDAGITQLSSARSRGGSAMAVLDAAASASRAGRDAATTEISNLGDADIFKAATELALSERALEASLSASVKSFSLSLLDKLG